MGATVRARPANDSQRRRSDYARFPTRMLGPGCRGGRIDVPGLQQRSTYNRWLLLAAFLRWQMAAALLRGPTMPRSGRYPCALNLWPVIFPRPWAAQWPPILALP
jgi:hypothetical protein